MSELERQLVGELPLVEASAFFVGVKHHGWPPSSEETYVKCASARISFQQAVDDLLAGRMPEGKAGKFKLAAANIRPAGLTNRQWVHEYYSRPDYWESLRKQAETNPEVAAAEQAMKDRVARQKEKNSAGAATLGTSRGAVKVATAAVRFQNALHKLAFTEAGGQEIVPNQQGLEPTPTPAPPAQPPTPPPAPPFESQQQQQQPVNYMAAEALGQQAQQGSESQFYRERLGKAVAENQQLQQTAQQLQQAVEQLQQQTAASGEQIQTATQQAVEASDRAMQHSQEAANMRMAIQQLRERVLQVASEEPPAITQQNVAQAEAAANQQMAMAGTPGAAPAPGGGAPPGTPPAGAGGQEQAPTAPGQQVSQAQPAAAGQKGQTDKGQSEQKTAASLRAVLGGGAIGAGIGTLGGLVAVRRAESARERVRKLQEQQESGFPAAVELAKAKLELASAELDESRPVRTTLREVGKGTLAGAVIGPMLAGQASRAARNVFG